MVYEFRLPDIGEGVAEGEVVQWFVKEGDVVREDAPLVSVLTDKANVEIPSPKSGKVLRLHAQAGEKVKVGGLLVTIETAGEGAGQTAPVPARSEESSPSPAPAAASTAPATPPTSEPGGRVLATPNVRRLAAEKGIDLSRVRGSGPNGRVTEADLTVGPAVAPANPPTPTPPTLLSASRPPESTPVAPIGEVQRIPIRGVRRVIAAHMTEARHRAAHYTYVEEVDASELVRMRERMAKHVEKHGVKLTYLPFIVKGVAAGLRAYPHVNSTMDDAKQELVVHPDINIGIATAAPEGLIVPVIKNADRKSISHLAKEIQELAEKGRAGKLQLSEITGGTFTITSLGPLGGVLATPILNYPEVAILGVHRIVRRPVYRADGSIGPADLMNLSVSLDHRVLDGIIGAQFLQVVKSYLEDPHQLFAELA
ncbi:MAG TPA: dihydrolipoamide acetyltransferase family protein [Thermoplasmata archaeon]|nr:dihydrolipoamide acetyltransferase family protein [Thermoplasmata archaeon]